MSVLSLKFGFPVPVLALALALALAAAPLFGGGVETDDLFAAMDPLDRAKSCPSR